MKALLLLIGIILTTASLNQSFSQFKKDTCNKVKLPPNSSGTYNLLYIANGILIRGPEINEKLIIDYDLLMCPASYYKFGFIASGGALILNTKQKFKTTSAREIAETKKLTGINVYAINDFFLENENFPISENAIVEISVESKDGINYINIWTLQKMERRN